MEKKISALCLKFTSSICEFNLEKEVFYKDNILSTKCIPRQYKRSRGDGKLTKQHEYLINDKILKLFSWEKENEPGLENKIELPPPLAEKLYFGNMYLIGFDESENLISIKKEDFRNLTEILFEGFEDLGSEDSWSTEEELRDDDSINDFIVPG